MDEKLLELRREAANLFLYKKWDEAILILTELIRRTATDPEVRAIAYATRGFAYHEKGQDEDMFKDSVEAVKCDKKLRLTGPVFYIAHKIDFTSLKEDEKIELFRHCISVADAIRRIEKKLYYETKDDEIAHYTSLDALKFLGDRAKHFRLYNAAYMNDPEEGKTLFEIMNDDQIMSDDRINVEDLFYKNNETFPYPSPAYIGSFVRVNPQREEKDELFLWRTYGKQNREEATGACLIFSSKLFSRGGAQMEIGSMCQQIDMGKTGPGLYRIAYKNDCAKDGDDLPQNLKKLAKALREIAEFKKGRKEEEVNGLVHELLDVVRFLFKADHYASENEARVILRSYKEENIGQIAVKLDMDRITPCFYMELPINIYPNQVILGPKARGISEWTHWLREHNKYIEVCQSKIKYGEQYL